MAKTPNYRQQKRQRELLRKSRQVEKQQERRERAAAPESTRPADPVAVDGKS